MTKENINIRQVVGLDVHSRKLAFSIWNTDGKVLTQDSKPTKTITGELKDFETIIQKHTVRNAEIVMEASTNVFKLSRIVEKLERKPIVVKSSTVKGYSPQYKVTDNTDAANLARAWISGFAGKVYIPTETEQEYRDIMRGYYNAVQDCTRISNRIWGFCSEHKIRLPKNLSIKQANSILEESKSELSEIQYFLLSKLVTDFKNAKESVANYAKTISYILANEPKMQELLQVLGVGPLIAFAAVAFIGDITRFKKPKQLCAYIGLVPSINASGERESKSHRIPRTGHPLLKSLLIQGAQAGLIHGELPMYRWARHLCARKQCRNIAVVALARKMVMYIWHIMMGHKITYKDVPQGLKNKINNIGKTIGKEKIALLGCKTYQEFIDNIINQMELEIKPPQNQELKQVAS